VRALLSAGADPDIVHAAYGHGPLHSAEAQVVRMLLEAGANPFLTDLKGYTADQWATAAKRTDAALLICDAQANTDRQPTNDLAAFVATLEPVEYYSPKKRSRHFGRWGVRLVHIMLFVDSRKEHHKEWIAAMQEAYSSYRENVFMNLVVDLALPDNLAFSQRFGAISESNCVRAIIFDPHSNGEMPSMEQLFPAFDMRMNEVGFDPSAAGSFIRFAEELEALALAPLVTVQFDTGGRTRPVSAAKVVQ
jgi:hypothetical protein